MHERYLYPSLVFVKLFPPLALESYEMMGVFVVLTITCLFNLVYVKQTLEMANAATFNIEIQHREPVMRIEKRNFCAFERVLDVGQIEQASDREDHEHAHHLVAFQRQRDTKTSDGYR